MLPGLTGFCGFNSEAAGASGPSSTQWRIYMTAIQGGQGKANEVVIPQLDMRGSVGGANLATGGTASASSNNGSASLAFTSPFAWSSSGGVPQWLQYTFASAVTIEEVVITEAGTTAGSSPTSFEIQYYNGSTWVTYWSVDYTGLWSAGVAKTLARGYASSSGPFRYHRMTVVEVYDSWPSAQASEVEFRPTAGGAKLSGTATGTNVVGGNEADKGYDGNTGTDWVTNGGAGLPQSFTLDMGSGNSGNVAQVAICPRGPPNTTAGAPKAFAIEGSNDGTTWTANFGKSNIANTWSHPTYRTFDR